MKRTDIIQKLIDKNGYKRYLEIGVRDGRNLNKIQVEHKDGVDPAGKCNFPIKSDDFFKQLDKDVKYDLVFIDGLHLRDQVLKDVENALKHLSRGGIIVLHDCNPAQKHHASTVYKGGTWNGTVWEAIVYLRRTREDLEMCVVNCDQGCGIVRPGKQDLLKAKDVSWSAFDKNRKEYLNLISTDEFLKRFIND